MTRPLRPLLVAAPLMLLAACDRPAPDNAAAPAAVATGNAADSVRALPEGQRAAVFLRAIRDAGRDCQGVTKAAEVTGAIAPSPSPTWQATCDDGSQWLVAIGADGVATVTNRADVREAGGGKAG